MLEHAPEGGHAQFLLGSGEVLPLLLLDEEDASLALEFWLPGDDGVEIFEIDEELALGLQVQDPPRRGGIDHVPEFEEGKGGEGALIGPVDLDLQPFARSSSSENR